jgi:F0F1-type ATP synthase beta subunit
MLSKCSFLNRCKSLRLYEEIKCFVIQVAGRGTARRNVSFLISNFLHVLNVVCFLLGNSPASEFYMPTFHNTLSHLHRRIGMKND